MQVLQLEFFSFVLIVKRICMLRYMKMNVFTSECVYASVRINVCASMCARARMRVCVCLRLYTCVVMLMLSVNLTKNNLNIGSRNARNGYVGN